VANTSPDMRLVQVMQDLGRADMDFDERKLLRAGRKLATGGRFPLMKTALGATLRQRLLADLADSNAKLARDFGVQFDMKLPSEPAEPLVAADPDYLLGLLGQMTLRPGQAGDKRAG
jgi:hypothetical protein